MTTAMSIASPRRVLAHKDNNTPLRQQSGLDNDLLKSPSRGVTSTSRRNVPAPPMPPKTGEKRKRTGASIFDEAESNVGKSRLRRASPSPKTVRLGSQDAVARASLRHEPLSQLSLLGDDDDDNMDGELSELITTSTSTLVASSSNLPLASTQPSSSQYSQDVVIIEEQFQLPDEMSQNSLEKIHAIKISHSQQHTSQLVPPIRPELLAEASQESFGMSTFIEYEKDGSDEIEGDVEMKEVLVQDDDLTMIQLPSSDVDPALRDGDTSKKSSDLPSMSQSPKLTQVCAHLGFSAHTDDLCRLPKPSVLACNSRCSRSNRTRHGPHSQDFASPVRAPSHQSSHSRSHLTYVPHLQSYLHLLEHQG